MAIWYWKYNSNVVATPTWTDMSTDKCGFFGTNYGDTVTAANWQSSTHRRTATPSDGCGSGVGDGYHMKNTKAVNTGSGTSTVDLGAGAVALTDANVAAGAVTMMLHFNHTTSVATQNGYFYCYDGTTTTTEAVGVDAVAWERGVSSAQTWIVINDDTTSGVLTTGNIGGNNSGERLSLVNQSAALDHYWYLCVSASPETAGEKTSFAFGIAIEYY